jgi:hypothetical protein
VQKLVELWPKNMDDKKKEILEAWGGIKIEHQANDPTPVALASGSSDYAGITARRVLNVKQTTRARRANNSPRSVWDRIEQVANSSQPLLRTSGTNTPPDSNLFPSLAQARINPPQPMPAFRQKPHTTAWSASASGSVPSSSTQPSIVPHSVPARPASPPRPGKPKPPPTQSQQAFPSLPASSRFGVPKEALGGNQSLRKIRGLDGEVPESVWGKPSSSTQASSSTPGTEGTGTANAKGKKKKGKETLFTIGAFPTV